MEQDPCKHVHMHAYHKRTKCLVEMATGNLQLFFNYFFIWWSQSNSQAILSKLFLSAIRPYVPIQTEAWT